MKAAISSLTISNLTFSYDKNNKPIVRDVNIEIPQGSITSLLGLNGSGKTTLLLLILGFLKPDHGKIIFEGNDGEKTIENINGKVGFLPQIENIPFDYPVKDFIMLGRSPKIKFFDIPSKYDYKKVADIYDFLELHDIKDKKLHEISGGELQRVRIARTLAQEPIIILMDEPMTHLDIKHKKNITELLIGISRQGKIVIYSTHDPLDAFNNSEYCILLRKDEKAHSGSSQELNNSLLLSKYFEMNIEIKNGESLLIHD